MIERQHRPGRYWGSNDGRAGPDIRGRGGGTV